MSDQDDFLENFRNKLGKKKSNEVNEQKEEESKEDNKVKLRTQNIEQAIMVQSQGEGKEEPRVSHFLKKNIYSGKLFGSGGNEPGLQQSKDVSQNGTPTNKKTIETIADIVANPDNFFSYTSNKRNDEDIDNNDERNKPSQRNEEEDQDSADCINLDLAENQGQAGRTSTNKVKILSHLKKKLKEEEEATGNIDIRPRLSVRDMIQNNEKRLQEIANEKSEEQRRSNIRQKNKEIWQSRMKEIAEFIRLEKEEGETPEEFYESNNEYLKDFGITNYKDFLSVQELIQFYEKGLIKPENKLAKGQRNTLGTKHAGLNISEIEEEKEEDNQNTRNDFNLKVNQYEKGTDLVIDNIKPTNKIEIASGQRMTYTSKPKSFNLIAKIIKPNDTVSYKGKEKELKLSINTAHTIKLSAKEKKPLAKQSSDLLYQSNPQQRNYKEASLSIHSSIKNTIASSKEKRSTLNVFDHNSTFSYFNQIKLRSKVVTAAQMVIQPSKRAPKVNVTSREIAQEVLMKGRKARYNSNELSIIRREVNVLIRYSYLKEMKIMMECFDEVLSKHPEYALSIENVLRVFYNGKKKSTDHKMQSYQGEAAVFGRPKPIAISSRIVNIGYFAYKPSISSSSIVNLPTTSVIGAAKDMTDRDYTERVTIPLYSNDDDIKRVKGTANKSNHYELREDEAIELQLKNHEELKEARPTLDKILFSNVRNTLYQKNIISSLDSINVMKYSLSSDIPFDPSFFDVLCISCYECVKIKDMDLHSAHCVIKLESYQDNQYDQDYNSRIFKLHESLKAKKGQIISTNNLKLISFYDKLLQVIYEILINNNSIEELDKSISQITAMINNELKAIDDSFHFYFLMFTQRLSQLVYMKLKDMEKILVMIQHNAEDSDEDYGQEEEIDPEEIKYVKMQLSSLESKQQQAQQELKQWRKEAKKLDSHLRKPMKNNNEILSDIVSDINSRAESVDIMTTFTGQGSEMNDYFDMDPENNPDEFTEEDQKKYFLALGLGVKFKYSDKIKDSVSIADLFEKAKSQNIPIGEYQNFILRELLPSGVTRPINP